MISASAALHARQPLLISTLHLAFHHLKELIRHHDAVHPKENEGGKVLDQQVETTFGGAAPRVPLLE